jgi:transcriptional regulator with XRE-family HTH domain
MTTFHERLKAERLRLALNQTDFARVGGVTKGTQINYESGKRTPDVLYLAAIAATGADVSYIVSGRRSALDERHASYTLRPDQKALLDNLDNCCKEDQDAIRRLALSAAGATDNEEAQPEPSLNKHELGQTDDENE